MKNPFSDAPVYYRDVTDSTMDDSKKEASGGILHGTVYRAGFQRKGRGRVSGRSWNSSEGENLLFTLVLHRDRLKQELNHMPLLAGAALLRAAGKSTGKDFNLKWPNDLLYKGRKCAGILCEADNRYFYCGIGVNCNQKIFPPELEVKSSSLSLIAERNIDLDSLLESLLSEFQVLLEGGDLWREEVEKSLYLKNRTIVVKEGRTDSDLTVEGINRGIGEDGQLLIECSDGTVREIYAGEIEIG